MNAIVSATCVAGYDPGEPLGHRCQILGVTGPKWSGKTLLGMTIAPGFHPPGHKYAGEPRTLWLDQEMSGGSYSIQGVHRIDMPSELRKKFGTKEISAIDRFLWWKEYLRNVPQGKYDLIGTDPITDIEAGMSAWVKANPQLFGYTAAQFSKMDAIAIGCVKDVEKQLILDLAARCKLFYFVAHEKNEWKGGRATGKTIAKGFDSLYEVANIYLKLEREKAREKDMPKPPSATLLKDRFSFQNFDPETGDVEIVPILPERIPICTPAKIREYVRNPVGRRKLRADEIAADDAKLTDDEKLLIQAEISQNNAQSAQLELTRIERMQQAAAKQAAANRNWAESTSTESESAESSASEPSDADSATATISDELIGKIKVLCGEAFDPGGHKAFLATWLKDREVAKVTELTQSQGEELEIDLLKLKSARTQAAAAEKLANGGTQGDAANVSRGSQTKEPEADASEPSGEGSAIAASVSAHSAGSAEHVDEEELGTVTKEQLVRIKSLADRTNWGRDAQERWLNAHGLANFRSLSKRMADDRINDLISVELGFSGDPPGN
jgi:hypothetical protein